MSTKSTLSEYRLKKDFHMHNLYHFKKKQNREN